MLFEKAVYWKDWQRKDENDGLRFWHFFADYAQDKLQQLRWSLEDKYIRLAEENLSVGLRVFEVDSKTIIDEFARKAIIELRWKVNDFPPYLRGFVSGTILEIGSRDLRWPLKIEIPRLVASRQEDLLNEFDRNCSRAYRALTKEARDHIWTWTEWNEGIEAEWLSRFSNAVHFNDLPQKMREFVQHRHNFWVDFARCRLRHEVRLTHIDLGIARLPAAAVITFIGVAVGLTQLIKRYRGGNPG
jgi:hypothetical protein